MSRASDAYHEGRAEEELELAQRASGPKAVKAHVELAELHMARIAEADPARDGAG